jgi:hypothetical protein
MLLITQEREREREREREKEIPAAVPLNQIGPAATEPLSAVQAVLSPKAVAGAAEDKRGRDRESDTEIFRESVSGMDDDLKEHLRQHHISRQVW